MEFIGEQLAQVTVLQARTDRRLDRAIRLAPQEARQERKRRKEMDEILAAGLRSGGKDHLARRRATRHRRTAPALGERRGRNGTSET